MIRLRHLLTEIEYGEKLWADPTANAKIRDQFRAFIDRIYNGTTEPDTPWEDTVFTALQNYLTYNEPEPGKAISQYVDELARLKSEFPDILDPRSAKKPPKAIYRAMTTPADRIPGYISLAKKIDSETLQHGPPGFQWPIKMIKLQGVQTNIASRVSRGFISASTEAGAAGTRLFEPRSGDTRWPVITVSPYNEVANKTIWNPDFLTMVGGFKENEVWILDNTIPVTDLYVWNAFDAPWDETTEAITSALRARGFRG
jgi:hypothetical protein